MAGETAISWADSTLNPWYGCTKVSPACDHCYAERLMDHRMHKVQWGAGQARQRTSAANWRLPLAWEKRAFVACPACGWRGDHTALRHDGGAHFCPHCGNDEWRPARRRVFCASLADVFDNEVDPAWRLDLFRLIAATPSIDWLLLTKRIGNATLMLADVRGLAAEYLAPFPWPNVWLGATICNQEEADRDIPKLLATPARVRFVSIEPMLGDVRLGSWLQRSPSEAFEAGRVTADMPPWTRIGSTALDWVICGGESGPHARPMHPDWVRSLRDQCAAAGVPFHFKQIGEWVSPGDTAFGRSPFREVVLLRPDGSVVDPASPEAQDENADVITMARVGTKAAGRLLDGIEHNGVPGNAGASR